MPVTTMGFGSGATHSYYQGGPWANLYSGSGTSPLSYTGGGLENPISPGPSQQTQSQGLGYSGIGTGLGNRSTQQPTQPQLPSWWNKVSAAMSTPGYQAQSERGVAPSVGNILAHSSGYNLPAGYTMLGNLTGADRYSALGMSPDEAKTAAQQDLQQQFMGWLTGPQSSLYKTAMTAPPEVAQQAVQQGLPDWLKSDIVQNYGSGGAYQAGGPLAAGGLYGTPQTPEERAMQMLGITAPSIPSAPGTAVDTTQLTKNAQDSAIGNAVMQALNVAKGGGGFVTTPPAAAPATAPTVNPAATISDPATTSLLQSSGIRLPGVMQTYSSSNLPWWVYAGQKGP